MDKRIRKKKFGSRERFPLASIDWSNVDIQEITGTPLYSHRDESILGNYTVSANMLNGLVKDRSFGSQFERPVIVSDERSRMRAEEVKERNHWRSMLFRDEEFFDMPTNAILCGQFLTEGYREGWNVYSAPQSFIEGISQGYLAFKRDIEEKVLDRFTTSPKHVLDMDVRTREIPLFRLERDGETLILSQMAWEIDKKVIPQNTFSPSEYTERGYGAFAVGNVNRGFFAYTAAMYDPDFASEPRRKLSEFFI